jgi:GNAT superfamily N-acetyltransferase
MERVRGPKTAILGRAQDRASGVAFVAVDGARAMLHALHVTAAQRRQGSAVNIMRRAAIWAQDHGATALFLAVTRHNHAANALYASLGMRIVGQYHYRSI